MTSISATKTDSADPTPSGMSRATKVRWAVAVFCAFGLAINYIDRSAISVSLPFMTQDFSLTPTEKGLILSAFSWSYALMQIPAGRLIDKFGERVMFGASVLVWSLFTAATAVVSSFGALLGLRLGLGVGEAGAYPAAAKTVSHWFPLRLRGRATSVYDSGARIGSAAATPLDRAHHRPVRAGKRRSSSPAHSASCGRSAGGPGIGAPRTRPGSTSRSWRSSTRAIGSRAPTTCTRMPSRWPSASCSSSARYGA